MGDTIELGKTISELGILVVIAAMFLIDNYRSRRYNRKRDEERDRAIMEQDKMLREHISVISDFSKAGLDLIKIASMKQVDIDQAKNLIRINLDQIKGEVVMNVIKIKQKNSLDDRDAVKMKVNLLLNSLYDSSVSFFRNIEYNSRPISFLFESAWKLEVRDYMIKDCEGSEIDIYMLDGRYAALFNSYKVSLYNKLYGENVNVNHEL
jgi:hypothetical protein